MIKMALCWLLTASLVFSIVALAAITGNAQVPSRTPDWVNIKDPRFGAKGDGSHDDTAAIQAAIDYAFAHNLSAVYCPAGTYKTSSTIYLDPPGNLRSNLTNPTNFAFSKSFFGDPAAGGDYQGCQLRPNFNNTVGFMVGTGQGMRVSDIAVIGPGGGYRGNQPSNGVGIGLAGGAGGSSNNLVENTYVSNFYTLYETGANGNGQLDDSNTFRKIAGDNGYYGVNIAASQNYIDDLVEPRLAATIGINSVLSKQVSVFGGNLSATSGVNNSFKWSGFSAFIKTPHNNGNLYTFTAAIASPDAYIPNVYNAYAVATTHFGVIPLLLIAWNSTTDVGTFELRPNWVWANYGINDLTTATNIQSEIAAATTLYAAEQVTVAQGSGILIDGTHVEDPSACSALINVADTFAGSYANVIRNPYLNYDPSTPGTIANLYCQRTFPFIAQVQGGPQLELDGGSFNMTHPALIEINSALAPTATKGLQLTGFWAFDGIVDDGGGYAWRQLNGNGQFSTEARGAGTWDRDYSFPPVWIGYSVGSAAVLSGELSSPFCGYEPCPWVMPQMSAAGLTADCPSGNIASCGTPNPINNTIPIACRTTFRSIDWNTGAVTPASTVGGGIFLRSASCPGYSWGQNLTNSVVGGTVTWSYMAGSDTLYIDAASMNYMFPGLGITLTNGAGAFTYIVTGIFPDLGYITVIGRSGNNLLQGTVNTVYSCSTACTIGQAPFAWTAY